MWQVSGRSECSFSDRLNLDVTYYNDRSLANDCKILTKTVGNVIKKEGAM